MKRFDTVILIAALFAGSCTGMLLAELYTRSRQAVSPEPTACELELQEARDYIGDLELEVQDYRDKNDALRLALADAAKTASCVPGTLFMAGGKTYACVAVGDKVRP